MAKELKIGNWYVGWHTWKTEITYSECGYEDGRANLTISLFGWLSRFYFPWKSKRFPYGDFDNPQWGIAIHSKILWIYRGGSGNLGGGTRWWTWDLPFVNYGTAVRWDVYVGDKDKPQSEWTKDDWKVYPRHSAEEIGTKWEYEITDPYDGEIIPCRIRVEEMEWRPKWLKWTSLFAKVRRCIDVEFAREVGKRKGSWKGGVLGCGHILKPNETIKECLDRMMKEKKVLVMATKIEVIYADLDGTLIRPISGHPFPMGIWDMQFKFSVLDMIREIQPKCLLIITNQGGIESGFVDKRNFEFKMEYICRSIKEYTGVTTEYSYCISNDENNKYRKPNIGMVDSLMRRMIKRGIVENGISTDSILMIGDASGKEGQFSDSDKRCAENAGLRYMDVDDFVQCDELLNN